MSKKISTPLGILLIVLAAVIVGVLVWQCRLEMRLPGKVSIESYFSQGEKLKESSADIFVIDCPTMVPTPALPLKVNLYFPKQVKEGKEFSIKLLIENQTASTLKDILIRLGPYAIENAAQDQREQTIKTLTPYETREVNWYLIFPIGYGLADSDELKRRIHIIISNSEGCLEISAREPIEIQEGKIDPEYCEKLTDSQEKAECYGRLFEKPKTLSTCEQIKDLRIRDMCYAELIDEGLKESQLCQRITNQSQKDLCFSDLAHELKDDNLCLAMQNENLKSECLHDIAVMTDNTSICDKITQQYYRDWCYLDLATILKDSNLCEKIKDKSARDSCYQEVVKNQ